MNTTFYQKLLENIAVGVYFVDRDRVIRYWNKGAEEISGYSRDEVVGRRCSDNILRHVDENGQEICLDACPLSAVICDGLTRKARVFLRHKQGHRVPVFVKGSAVYDRDGTIEGAVEVFSVNSKMLESLETIAQLREEVLRDSLTGIGNRKAAQNRLEQLLQAPNFGQPDLGLLFVDIDLFKHVNDTYGHGVGDQVLCLVARTLAAGLRHYDQLFRWGGEEFVITLPDITADRLGRIAQRLRQLVEDNALDHAGERVRVTVSVGGAIARPGDTPHSLVDRADAQVYRSKQAGRNRVHIDAPWGDPERS